MHVQPELIADCVHCGFCLPTCPTYKLWHEEMDSPRGRIWLMAGLVDGTIELTDTVAEHFDRCLGCMACVPACPSGVKYDRLIELTRDYVEEHHRALGRRTAAARADLRRLPAPPTPPRRARAPPSAGARPVPAAGRPRAAVARARPGRREHLPGRGPARRRCSPAASRASSSARSTPRRPACSPPTATRCTCRGRRAAAARCTRTPAARTEGARASPRARASARRLRLHRHQRRRLRLAPEGSRHRERRRRLGAARRTRSARPSAIPLELRVAFQDSCHLKHAQRIELEPRAALAPDSRAELARAGRAGDLLRQRRASTTSCSPRPRASSATARPANVLATEPDVYASGNPGCLLQVTAALRRAGKPLPAFHPIELVDASIRGVPATDLLRQARR